MNIRIIKIIRMYLVLWHVASCQNKANFITQILIATPVGTNFVSSDENCDMIINGQKYWIHYKISYENGKIDSFKRYLPEGSIDYTNEELLSDTAIYLSLNVPFIQKWEISPNLNLKTKTKTVKLI